MDLAQENKELKEQLAAAVDFVKKNQEIAENYKLSAELYKQLYDDSIVRIQNSIPKCIPVTVPDKQLNAIKGAAAAGVRETSCKMPETDAFSKQIADAVANKISPSIKSKFKEAAEKAKIKVEHTHYHWNRLGQFASSETNEKVMTILAIITSISVAFAIILILGLNGKGGDLARWMLSLIIK